LPQIIKLFVIENTQQTDPLIIQISKLTSIQFGDFYDQYCSSHIRS
jgi:hypothetical protein